MSETLTVRLDEETSAALAAEAARVGRPKGQIVREVLNEHLRRKRTSALDALREYVGCLEGAPDLSTNKAHLANFGKSGAGLAGRGTKVRKRK